jgi:RNA polymerase sigma-70 factor (sigma-E family)
MMAAMAPSPPGPAHGWPELDTLYREHYRSLVKLASLLVDDVGTCEEIVQDAFVAVHRRGPMLRDEAKAPAYLRSAVLNGARSQLRRRQVRRRHLAPVPDPAPPAEHGAIASDEQRRVIAALRSLPDRQRDVLTLRYYLDLSEAEIAQTLGISPGSVKTHAHRGLAALAERLEGSR